MRSILLASAAIALWSSLAVLGTRVSHLPPLLSVGIALVIGGLAGALRFREWRVPPATFALGIAGIFGYHVLLFTAFRLAPAVEANLLNYLWPLLIVVLSPVYLPGMRLSFRHAAGAVLGLAGAVLLVSGGRVAFDRAHLDGYLLAATAAFVWASYSLLSRRVRPFSTGAVGGFCLASGALALLCHLLGRRASHSVIAVPLTPADLAFLLLLGLGPMGAAFYAWDAALKRGDPRVIGSLAYLTPLLSTLNLVAFGGGTLTPVAAAAMALILAGAIVGASVLRRGSASRTASGSSSDPPPGRGSG